MGQIAGLLTFDPRVESAFMKRFAQLAILTLVLQFSSLGHWSIGPFHPMAGDLSAHVAHCHGDSSACGGQPSLVGTLAGVNLTPAAPLGRAAYSELSVLAPREASITPPGEPPRS